MVDKIINGASALLGLGSDVYNTIQNKKMDDFNMDMALRNAQLQKDVFDWQKSSYQQDLDYKKALQQKVFAREDTAYQRAVEDAKNAGLSPLVVSGGAGAGSVVSTSGSNASAGNVATQLQRQQARLDITSQMASIRSVIDQNKINKEIGKAEVEKIKADTDYTKAQELMTLRNLDNDKKGNTVQERVAFIQSKVNKELAEMSDATQRWLSEQSSALAKELKDIDFNNQKELNRLTQNFEKLMYSQQVKDTAIAKGLEYIHNFAIQKKEIAQRNTELLANMVQTILNNGNPNEILQFIESTTNQDRDLQNRIVRDFLVAIDGWLERGYRIVSEKQPNGDTWKREEKIVDINFE